MLIYNFLFFLPIIVYYRHPYLITKCRFISFLRTLVFFVFKLFIDMLQLFVWSLTAGHLGIFFFLAFFSYYKKCCLWWIFLHFILLNNWRIISTEIILQNKILANRIACNKYWRCYIKLRPTYIFVTFLFLVCSLRSVQSGCYVRGAEMKQVIY